jgi:hypothetical protein
MELELSVILGRLDQIEQKSVSLNDLSLEKQLKFLTSLKNLKDCEKKPVKGKGFSNSLVKNQKRSKDVYTVAEAKFKAISDSFELNHLHEWCIPVKDAELQLHNYKLDFYYPESKIAVEISPNFHFSYKPVFIRDKIRKKALNQKFGIKVFTVKANQFNEIDVKYARNILRIIKAAQTSPETLEYWFSGGELLNQGGIAGGQPNKAKFKPKINKGAQ